MIGNIGFVVLEIYWVGIQSAHSQSALLEIHLMVAIAGATAAAVSYFLGLLFQGTKISSVTGGVVTLVVLSGLLLSGLFRLTGPGVLVRPVPQSDAPFGNFVWLIFLLPPFSLSFLVSLKVFLDKTEAVSRPPVR